MQTPYYSLFVSALYANVRRVNARESANATTTSLLAAYTSIRILHASTLRMYVGMYTPQKETADSVFFTYPRSVA